MNTPNPTAGASLEAWERLERVVGTSILLPVVSDLSVPIHEKSTIKQMGKVPGQIYKELARGFPAWTRHVTTDQDIQRWSRDRRHGISIRTGAQEPGCTQVVCIDNDIGDPAASKAIEQLCQQFIGPLPVRRRSNSSKCLMPFVMRGEFVKRVLHTAHGPIEFLAHGQQFVAIGTHPSGVRYTWEGWPDTELPSVTPDQFENLWYALAQLYAIEPERVPRGGLMRRVTRDADGPSVNDDIANFLEANNWVRSWMPDGRLNITCPWVDQHTSSDVETATQYMPAGVGKKEDGTPFKQGHFECLHAHCVGRTDSDFLDAIGIMDAEFEDVSVKEPASAPATADDYSDLIGDVPAADIVMLDGTVMPAEEIAKPAFRRKRDGTIKAEIGNVVLALRRPDVCGHKIAHDQFRDELMIGSSDTSKHDWRPFGDHHYTELRMHLGANSFDAISKDMIRDAVLKVAQEQQFDAAQVWLDKVNPPWDGVMRIETFFPRYFRTEDTPYTRACGMYLWSALAGRIIVPGVKADMSPILKSPPGTKKTSTIESLAPDESFFVEINLSDKDDDIARKLRGKLVAEIAELRGLHGRDRESVLSWFTRRFEEWTPKYREFTTRFPRRMIPIGTTNEDEILNNPNGERRFLPMTTGEADIDAIKADRGQLWAEGAAMFRKAGVQWQDAQRLAPVEHDKFKINDSWGERVQAWLDEPAFGKDDGTVNGDEPIRVSDILQSAIGVSMQQIGRAQEMRMAAILRTIGFKRVQKRVNGVANWVWVKESQ